MTRQREAQRRPWEAGLAAAALESLYPPSPTATLGLEMLFPSGSFFWGQPWVL